MNLDIHLRGLRRVVFTHSEGNSITVEFEKPCSILRWLMGQYGGQRALEKPPEECGKIVLEDGSTMKQLLEIVEVEIKECREVYKKSTGQDSDWDSFYESAKVTQERDMEKYGEGDDTSDF